MAELKKVNTRIIHKHATAAVWHEKQFIPLQGEIIIYDPGYDPKDGVTYTYERMKVGDGARKVTDLPFVSNVPDWNQLDETAPDYIKNRTHYESVSSNFVDVLTNFTFTIREIDKSSGLIRLFGRPSIEWNYDLYKSGEEVTYTLTLQNGEVRNYQGINNEDANISVGEWGQEGYMYLGDIGDGTYIELYLSPNNIDLSDTVDAKISVQVLRRTTELKKLDEKFIPDSVARKSYVDNATSQITNSLNNYVKTINDKESNNGKITLTYNDLEDKPFYSVTVNGYQPIGPLDGSEYNFTAQSNNLYVKEFGPYDGDAYFADGHYVTWDGVLYECFDTPEYYDEDDYGHTGRIGNLGFSTYPFCIEYKETWSVGIEWIKVYTNQPGKHTIKVANWYEQTFEEFKTLDEKFIPDTIARVDQYDKYGKDSFSVNDTAKAISAKSAAFGYNTQAGSYAFTVLDLDATNKTFTLDSTEGLNVGDIYTVDISFYNKSDVATEELFVDYGKITEISENVVTVDVFPDTVSRYRYSGNPYVDSNGIDREENVFRVIAKPTVGTRAIGTSTFVSGNASQALSKNAVSMGTLNVAYGPHSVALGATNTANYAATALGIGNNANGKRSIAAGNGNSTSGYIAVAIGNENEATGMFSVGIGSKNTSSGTGSIALGVNNQSDWASSVAIGELNVSSGNCSVALGRQNTSSGGQSFTGGFNNTASGQFSVAIGNQNKALEQGAVALGSSNTSSGINSVSLGNANTASNKNAFAVGTKNKASGPNSASIGNNNEASGSASFAQGYQAKATNECCVALGNNSKASGKNSFAVGPRAEASGTTSVAIGQGVKAARANQIVFGKYNIMDTNTSSSYAVIIGNGSGEDVTDDSGNVTTQNRSNAHTLDWKGNAWFAGSLTIGPDKDSIATMNDVNNKIEDTLLETLYINCGTASDLID